MTTIILRIPAAKTQSGYSRSTIYRRAPAPETHGRYIDVTLAASRLDTWLYIHFFLD